MQIAAEKVKAFEQERKQFLMRMQNAITANALGLEEKKILYQELMNMCSVLNLQNMQITDQRKQYVVDITNAEELLMAVGTYRANIRNIFIKRLIFNEEPFKELIQEHEKNVISILGLNQMKKKL